MALSPNFRGKTTIAEELRPVVDESIRGDYGGEFLLAAHEHVGELEDTTKLAQQRWFARFVEEADKAGVPL